MSFKLLGWHEDEHLTNYNSFFQPNHDFVTNCERSFEMEICKKCCQKKAYVYQGYAFIEYENKQEAFCSVPSVRGLSEI